MLSERGVTSGAWLDSRSGSPCHSNSFRCIPSREDGRRRSDLRPHSRARLRQSGRLERGARLQNVLGLASRGFLRRLREAQAVVLAVERDGEASENLPPDQPLRSVLDEPNGRILESEAPDLCRAFELSFPGLQDAVDALVRFRRHQVAGQPASSTLPCRGNCRGLSGCSALSWPGAAEDRSIRAADKAHRGTAAIPCISNLLTI